MIHNCSHNPFQRLYDFNVRKPQNTDAMPFNIFLPLSISCNGFWLSMRISVNFNSQL